MEKLTSQGIKQEKVFQRDDNLRENPNFFCRELFMDFFKEKIDNHGYQFNTQMLNFDKNNVFLEYSCFFCENNSCDNLLKNKYYIISCDVFYGALLRVFTALKFKFCSSTNCLLKKKCYCKTTMEDLKNYYEELRFRKYIKP